MPVSTDCIDAAFGYQNKDGYVRIWDKDKSSGGRLVMRHRWFWETYIGKIPDEYEINHLCKNRRCFNLDHLECIHGSEHASKDNASRYSKDYQGFCDYVESIEEGDMPSQESIGRVFNRSQACISKWFIKYRESKDADIH